MTESDTLAAGAEVAAPQTTAVRPGFPLYLVIFALMLGIDQASKAWARAEFRPSERLALWPNVFELTLTYNEGIAFGLFKGAGVLFAPIALVIAIGSGWYSWRHPKEGRFVHFSLAMLAAGAIGNLVDRLWLGRVTDMFYIAAIEFPVFNWADTCITFAAILLGFHWIVRSRDEGEHRAPKK
ncbi:MAG TPA: signal peptidase II [Fimbriimonadaceae bacterium]|nr:signal peptidase II [Fimbriimonadaceae bacterium]HRJ97394.1 signal peptidase II [Fimbriimonadaceae bacterium]